MNPINSAASLRPQITVPQIAPNTPAQQAIEQIEQANQNAEVLSITINGEQLEFTSLQELLGAAQPLLDAGYAFNPETNSLQKPASFSYSVNGQTETFASEDAMIEAGEAAGLGTYNRATGQFETAAKPEQVTVRFGDTLLVADNAESLLQQAIEQDLVPSGTTLIEGDDGKPVLQQPDTYAFTYNGETQTFPTEQALIDAAVADGFTYDSSTGKLTKAGETVPVVINDNVIDQALRDNDLDPDQYTVVGDPIVNGDLSTTIKVQGGLMLDGAVITDGGAPIPLTGDLTNPRVENGNLVVTNIHYEDPIDVTFTQDAISQGISTAEYGDDGKLLTLSLVLPDSDGTPILGVETNVQDDGFQGMQHVVYNGDTGTFERVNIRTQAELEDENTFGFVRYNNSAGQEVLAARLPGEQGVMLSMEDLRSIEGQAGIPVGLAAAMEANKGHAEHSFAAVEGEFAIDEQDITIPPTTTPGEVVPTEIVDGEEVPTDIIPGEPSVATPTDSEDADEVPIARQPVTYFARPRTETEQHYRPEFPEIPVGAWEGYANIRSGEFTGDAFLEVMQDAILPRAIVATNRVGTGESVDGISPDPFNPENTQATQITQLEEALIPLLTKFMPEQTDPELVGTLTSDQVKFYAMDNDDMDAQGNLTGGSYFIAFPESVDTSSPEFLQRQQNFARNNGGSLEAIASKMAEQYGGVAVWVPQSVNTSGGHAVIDRGSVSLQTDETFADVAAVILQPTADGQQQAYALTYDAMAEYAPNALNTQFATSDVLHNRAIPMEALTLLDEGDLSNLVNNTLYQQVYGAQGAGVGRPGASPSPRPLEYAPTLPEAAPQE
jgi:hypothetical protein